MDKAELIKKLPFYDRLTAREKDVLLSRVYTKTFLKGETVHRSEAECLGMIYVLSGELRTYILSDEGREVTLFRIWEGDACVTSASCVISEITFDTFMVAEEEATLLIVPSNIFSEIVEHNIYVRCFAYELLAEKFSDVMWSFQQILFKKFDVRLAVYLTEEYNVTGNAEIRKTHEQIAKQTSSAREVVTRMLKRFSDAGLVELTRNSVLLKDIDRIKALASE